MNLGQLARSVVGDPQRVRQERLALAREAARRHDRWGVWAVCGYEPVHAAQEAFHRSDAPRRVLRFGRRGGKTLALAAELTAVLLQDGARAWVVAPEHDTGERLWRALLAFMLDEGRGEARRIGLANLGIVPTSMNRAAPRTFTTPWGSVLSVKSCEPSARSALVGDSLDALVVDEAALVPDLEALWGSLLEPNLSDRDGWGAFASTPMGPAGFFYQIDGFGRDPERPEWESFFAPSWANPKFSKVALRIAQATTSAARYRQAYGAEYGSTEERIYQEWDPATHVRPVEWDPQLPLCAAVDVGTTEHSPFAVVYFQPVGDKLHIIDEFYVVAKPSLQCAHEWLRFHRERGYPRLAIAAIDISARDARHTIEDVLRGEDLLPRGGFDYSSQSVESGIERVRLLLRDPTTGEARLFASPRCKRLADEFLSYTWWRPRAEDAPEKRPVKAHDHGLDATRYGVTALENSPSLCLRTAREAEHAAYMREYLGLVEQGRAPAGCDGFETHRLARQWATAQVKRPLTEFGQRRRQQLRENILRNAEGLPYE